MPGEFELIERYFAGDRRRDVLLGIGDDAAIVRPRGDLALAVDTLVAGVHFPPDAPPEAVGHKALAVNLSDLAAMGAEPAWLLLALTLPTAEEQWLDGFSRGLRGLAAEHEMALIGGDVTRGELTLSVQIGGYLPRGQGLRRSGARAGDLIFVSGSLGDAALGLELWQAGERGGAPAIDWLLGRLHHPTPRVALGRALLDLATAAVDLSDGLAADLGHVLAASGVGATVELARLPLSPAFRRHGPAEPWPLAVAGGDDYELCFTAPATARDRIARQAEALGLALTCVGRIDREPGLRLIDPGGGRWQPAHSGYTHFPGSGAPA